MWSQKMMDAWFLFSFDTRLTWKDNGEEKMIEFVDDGVWTYTPVGIDG